MTTYTTLDYLPDLSASSMNSARALTFQPYEPTYSYLAWDNRARFATSADNAALFDNFVFDGVEGATYDIYSNSSFDPFDLRLYDNLGNVVAADTDFGEYGADSIYKYVAPYTGEYYVSASWDQGSVSSDKYVSLYVYEDINTISDLQSNIDRIFNWGESIAPNFLPENSNSQEIANYYARPYSNGNIVGGKDGAIWLYDGSEITIIGNIDALLSQANLEGF
jgi:hypothetical protein